MRWVWMQIKRELDLLYQERKSILQKRLYQVNLKCEIFIVLIKYSQYFFRFTRLSSIKCDRCGVNLQRNDLIMKCKSRIYHMDCFSCSVCHKKLLPGDEFQLKNELLYCKKDAILTSTYNHTQLYLTGLNPPSNTFVNSSVSMTPENSINSSASMSSSTSTFSPSNNSTSSCSSVVDSPTNSSGFNTLSSTNSSILLSHSSFNFNSTTNSYFHLDSNNNNTSHKSGNDMVANKTANSYFEYDYQDKEGKQIRFFFNS